MVGRTLARPALRLRRRSRATCPNPSVTVAAYRQQRCCYDDTRQTTGWPVHDDVSSARSQGRVAAVGAVKGSSPGHWATAGTRRLRPFARRRPAVSSRREADSRGR